MFIMAPQLKHSTGIFVSEGLRKTDPVQMRTCCSLIKSMMLGVEPRVQAADVLPRPLYIRLVRLAALCNETFFGDPLALLQQTSSDPINQFLLTKQALCGEFDEVLVDQCIKDCFKHSNHPDFRDALFSICSEAFECGYLKSLGCALKHLVLVHPEPVAMFLLEGYLPKLMKSEIVTEKLTAASMEYVDIVDQLDWRPDQVESIKESLWGLAGHVSHIHGSLAVAVRALRSALRLSQDNQSKSISLKGLLLLLIQQDEYNEALSVLEAHQDVEGTAFLGVIAAVKCGSAIQTQHYVELVLSQEARSIEDLLMMAQEVVLIQDGPLVRSTLTRILDALVDNTPVGWVLQILQIVRWLMEDRFKEAGEQRIADEEACWLLRLMQIVSDHIDHIQATTECEIVKWFRDVTFNLALTICNSGRYLDAMSASAPASRKSQYIVKLRQVCSFLFYSQLFGALLPSTDKEDVDNCLLLHAGARLQLGRIGHAQSNVDDLLVALDCLSMMSEELDPLDRRMPLLILIEFESRARLENLRKSSCELDPTACQSLKKLEGLEPLLDWLQVSHGELSPPRSCSEIQKSHQIQMLGCFRLCFRASWFT
eukprot:Blabericola_migrator_1__4377@NODE_234_length_11037_cov_77_854421_g199_i0_p3_GENE_NODE_234_length_11037_cov_77_854421_g199_i0NODE_234_length_11037_cov_77_854421_g199_i0_p3_ORF_typecomplete_len596_score82_08TPR_15/PF13429_6/0_0063TPR_15/PF13429_6/4_3e03TPR_MalT/PF17874_1/0_027TPR_MalT/PF17874_1/1_5e03TPR_21/PF09976_9/0_15TPR_21/PF09976_9/7_3e02ANAPC3/PF12895_7/0_56ANAPC3/PF12895_7/1_5e04ANAPC3/PF12895_7/5_4e02Coatomer_E/PF04733_14/0_5Coatomer_E/PF04733_14/2_9e02TPR_5/PF12688_7/6_3TPR_5/PF12688_7/8